MSKDFTVVLANIQSILPLLKLMIFQAALLLFSPQVSAFELTLKEYMRHSQGRMKPGCFLLPEQKRSATREIVCLTWFISPREEGRELLVLFQVYSSEFRGMHSESLGFSFAAFTTPEQATCGQSNPCIFFREKSNPQKGWVFDVQRLNFARVSERSNLRDVLNLDQVTHWVKWLPLTFQGAPHGTRRQSMESWDRRNTDLQSQIALNRRATLQMQLQPLIIETANATLKKIHELAHTQAGRAVRSQMVAQLPDFDLLDPPHAPAARAPELKLLPVSD